MQRALAMCPTLTHCAGESGNEYECVGWHFSHTHITCRTHTHKLTAAIFLSVCLWGYADGDFI